MPRRPPTIQQGSIPWANIRSPNGQVKKRPIVVLTATDEIVLDEPLVGVAVSTLVSEPLPDGHIEIPWQVNGHPATRLRRRSVAVCNWLIQVTRSELEPTEAYVPSKTLLAIIQAVRRLNE